MRSGLSSYRVRYPGTRDEQLRVRPLRGNVGKLEFGVGPEIQVSRRTGSVT